MTVDRFISRWIAVARTFRVSDCRCLHLSLGVQLSKSIVFAFSNPYRSFLAFGAEKGLSRVKKHAGQSLEDLATADGE